MFKISLVVVFSMELQQSLGIQHFCHWTWANIVTILWITQSITMTDGSSNIEAKTVKTETVSYLIPQPVSLLNVKKLELDVRCESCRRNEKDEMCSGSDHGECTCINGNAICRCQDKWTGHSCQYQISKITCEKMRNCILCQVHSSGPLAEGDDCKLYCDNIYPTPLVVKTLQFQDDEHLCSFMHHEEDSAHCRYFFKYGQVNPDGTLESANFYVVAQREMHCGKPIKFPQLIKSNQNYRSNETFQRIAKSYEEIVNASEENESSESENLRNQKFFTVVFVFVLIALPFVTCAFSIIYNFSTLPCGLCNMFRQSSSKYLRNVRPFPGFMSTEETSTV